MDKYLFHEVADQIYHFVWHTYCDWYIEFAKSLFNSEITTAKETKSTAIWVFGEILKLSHPVMPFITESLWHKLFNNERYLINEVSIELANIKKYELSQNYFKNLIQIISSVRNLRSELDIPYKNKIILNIKNSDKEYVNFIKVFENEIIRLLKLEFLHVNDESIKNIGSANLVCSDSTIIIPLAGIIDTNLEINKLIKKKKEGLLKLKNLSAKLNNKNFVEKAPKNVFLQFNKQLEDIKISIDKIDQIINTIK